MVLFSDLQRFALVDGRGQRARLLDAAIELSVGDYPPVTLLVFVGRAGSPTALPWEAVTAHDWRRRRLVVANLDAAPAAERDSFERAVLLKRDVLDALVLDLANRRATRANDLWLRDEGGRLILRGVDASAWAVLRRLSRGRLGRGDERNLLDWRDVEFLRGDPRAAQAGRDYHR
jgi:hypothetical protein